MIIIELLEILGSLVLMGIGAIFEIYYKDNTRHEDPNVELKLKKNRHKVAIRLIGSPVLCVIKEYSLVICIVLEILLVDAIFNIPYRTYERMIRGTALLAYIYMIIKYIGMTIFEGHEVMEKLQGFDKLELKDRKIDKPNSKIKEDIQEPPVEDKIVAEETVIETQEQERRKSVESNDEKQSDEQQQEIKYNSAKELEQEQEIKKEEKLVKEEKIEIKHEPLTSEEIQKIKEQLAKYFYVIWEPLMLHKVMRDRLEGKLLERYRGIREVVHIGGLNYQEIQLIYKFDNYYKKEIITLLSLIEDMKIDLKGREKAFSNLLMECMQEHIYKRDYAMYKDITRGSKDLNTSIIYYLSTFHKEEAFEIEKLSYLASCMKYNGIPMKDYSLDEITNCVNKVYPEYEKAIKLKKLKQRMSGTEQKESISIEAIDQMKGLEFEKFLGELFTKLGYTVQVTKSSGDQGADLIIVKNGEKTAVQAKRYKGSVGNDAVQQVIAAKTYYNVDRTMVVTNSTFTNSARTLAEKSGTKLIDRNKLIDMMELVF